MHGFIGISISDVGFLLQYYPTSSIRHLKSGDDKIHYIVCQSVVKNMFLGMRSQEKHAAFSKNRCGIKRKRLIINRLSTAFSTQTRGRTGIHWCLRPARLPIPPSGRFAFAFRFISQMRCKGKTLILFYQICGAFCRII